MTLWLLAGSCFCISLCISNYLSVLPEVKNASKIHLFCTALAVLWHGAKCPLRGLLGSKYLAPDLDLYTVRHLTVFQWHFSRLLDEERGKGTAEMQKLWIRPCEAELRAYTCQCALLLLFHIANVPRNGRYTKSAGVKIGVAPPSIWWCHQVLIHLATQTELHGHNRIEPLRPCWSQVVPLESEGSQQ